MEKGKVSSRKINITSLIFLFVTVTIGLGVTITNLIYTIMYNYVTAGSIISIAGAIVLYSLALVYGLVGYKTTKFNLFRLAILLFGLIYVGFSLYLVITSTSYMHFAILLIIPSLIAIFMLGRLHAYRQTLVFGGISTALLITFTIYALVTVIKHTAHYSVAENVVSCLIVCNPLVIFVSLIGCYLATHHYFPELFNDYNCAAEFEERKRIEEQNREDLAAKRAIDEEENSAIQASVSKIRKFFDTKRKELADRINARKAKKQQDFIDKANKEIALNKKSTKKVAVKKVATKKVTVKKAAPKKVSKKVVKKKTTKKVAKKSK